MRNIKIADYTLREMNNNQLLFREKTAIAACIDRFGADAIELSPVNNLKEDTIIYKTIASLVNNCRISIPVGFDEEKIIEAYDCIKNAKNPCLQIEVPVSTVTMEYTYHYKAEKMLAKVASLCKKAKEYCDNIEFVALDATRAELPFVTEIINTAKENGAVCATVCDDAGIMLPYEFEEFVSAIKKECDIPLYVKVNDSMKMATATAVYAIKGGADGIKASVNGKTALKISDFASVLQIKGEAMGICANIKTTEIKSDIKELLKSVKRDTLSDDILSTSADDVLLTKESTLADTLNCAEKLGYTLSAEDNGKVYKALMRICGKKPCVGSKEFEAVIASNAMQVPATYHLDSYNICTNNMTASMSNVVLTKGDKKLSGMATGDGPIDSALFAIEQCVGFHYELDSFQIEAVTEGTEALGSTVVKLRSNGKLYSGNGISSDIVEASIRAYIAALNKIVYEEGLN